MDRLLRLLPPPIVSIVFVCSLFLFYTVGHSLFCDNDTPWHIAAGNLIRTVHNLPRTDSWSYASAGVPWYNLSWAWDILLSRVTEYTGQRGLFNATYGFYALILALLCYALLGRKGIHPIAAVFTVILVGYVIAGFCPARPHSFTFFATILFMFVLHRSRTAESAWGLLSLPLLMLIWVNMHGGFPVGFTVLGAYVIEALISKRWKWLSHLMITSLVCLAVTFLTPYGFDLYTGAMRSLDSIMNSHISEWLPFAYGNDISISIFVLIFILVSSASDKSMTLADKILAFFWVYRSLIAQRHFAICTIIAAPYVATMMSHCLGLAHRHAPALPPYFRLPITTLALIATGLLITFPIQPNQGAFICPGVAPLDAISFVKDNYPTKRFYNDYSMGGYLIYYYADDDHKIFVDGRAGTAYPEQTLKEYLAISTAGIGWEKIIDHYHIDGMIIYNSDPFYALYARGLYHDQWTQVFTGTNASVYIKKE